VCILELVDSLFGDGAYAPIFSLLNSQTLVFYTQLSCSIPYPAILKCKSFHTFPN